MSFPQTAARMSTNAELPPVKIQIAGVAYGQSRDATQPPQPQTTDPEKNDGEVNDAR